MSLNLYSSNQRVMSEEKRQPHEKREKEAVPVIVLTAPIDLN